MKNETWKKIFDGRYAVSNRGRIRRVAPRKDGVRPKILKPYVDRKGYKRISLCTNRGVIGGLLHRVVALTFLGPRPPFKEINHIDGNKLNNCVANLEYVSQAENMRHAQVMGLKARGERHPSAKLTPYAVRSIRNERKLGLPAWAIAAHFLVSTQTVYDIEYRRTWSHIK